MKKLLSTVALVLLLSSPLFAFQSDEALYDWFVGQEFSWEDATGNPIDISVQGTNPGDLSGLVLIKACYVIPLYGMICDAIGQTEQFKVRNGNILAAGAVLTVRHNGDLVVLDRNFAPIYQYLPPEAD